MTHRTPRQDELCTILAKHFDGGAPSKSAVYMQLQYRGGSSNRYGSQVMERARRAGLIREVSRNGNAIAVELTEAGWARASA